MKAIERLKSPLIVLGAGIALGVLADALFYGMPVGVSFPLVVLLILIALFILALAEKLDIAWSNLWLILPIIFLSVMSAVRAAPLLRFLNISGTLILLALLVRGITGKPLVRLNFGGYAAAALESTFMSSLVTPAALLIRSGSELGKRDRGGLRGTRRIVTGVALAIPLLVMFAALFASADQIFDALMRQTLDRFSLPNILGHMLLAVALSWLFAGGLAYGLSQPRLWWQRATDNDLPENEQSEQPADALAARFKGLLGTVESGIVLFSIDGLFALFVAIQFAALFGGEAFLQRQGLTYSEYARRGFFQLLAVSLITLALILVLDFLTDRQTPRTRRVFLIGAGLMIVMTIIILASAYYRMQLYELAYGFTTLRVYPHIFMIWLAVLFAYFLIFLLLSRTRYVATGVVAASLGFIVTMNLLNPDAFIVRQNITRYEAGETLDAAYLGTLSADAIPPLMPLLYEYDGAFLADVAPWLHFHLNELDSRAETAGWPSYHISLSRAERLLDANRSLLETFDAPASRYEANYLYNEVNAYEEISR